MRLQNGVISKEIIVFLIVDVWGISTGGIPQGHPAGSFSEVILQRYPQGETPRVLGGVPGGIPRGSLVPKGVPGGPPRGIPQGIPWEHLKGGPSPKGDPPGDSTVGWGPPRGIPRGQPSN